MGADRAPQTSRRSDDSVSLVLQILASLRARQFTADVATDLDQYGLAVPAEMVTLRGDVDSI